MGTQFIDLRLPLSDFRIQCLSLLGQGRVVFGELISLSGQLVDLSVQITDLTFETRVRLLKRIIRTDALTTFERFKLCRKALLFLVQTVEPGKQFVAFCRHTFVVR